MVVIAYNTPVRKLWIKPADFDIPWYTFQYCKAEYFVFSVETTNKSEPDPVVGLDRLAALCGVSAIPVVAIGGITVATAADVAREGEEFERDLRVF